MNALLQIQTCWNLLLIEEDNLINAFWRSVCTHTKYEYMEQQGQVILVVKFISVY